MDCCSSLIYGLDRKCYVAVNSSQFILLLLCPILILVFCPIRFEISNFDYKIYRGNSLAEHAAVPGVFSKERQRIGGAVKAGNPGRPSPSYVPLFTLHVA